MKDFEKLQEAICEAVDIYDYELSIQKDAGEQIMENLQTIEGCHLVIEILLGFLEGVKDE